MAGTSPAMTTRGCIFCFTMAWDYGSWPSARTTQEGDHRYCHNRTLDSVPSNPEKASLPQNHPGISSDVFVRSRIHPQCRL
jgi:hypothetical protein